MHYRNVKIFVGVLLNITHDFYTIQCILYCSCVESIIRYPRFRSSLPSRVNKSYSQPNLHPNGIRDYMFTPVPTHTCEVPVNIRLHNSDINIVTTYCMLGDNGQSDPCFCVRPSSVQECCCPWHNYRLSPRCNTVSFWWHVQSSHSRKPLSIRVTPPTHTHTHFMYTDIYTSHITQQMFVNAFSTNN